MIQFLEQLLRTVFRLAMVVAGLVFGAVLLFIAAGFTVAFVLWNLLRGRRPAMKWQRVDPRAWSGRGRAAPPRGEVLDIEAREVPDAPAPASHRVPD